ncbi:hypothetical protein [Brevibacillus brevis]|nr:hypothetical protein [Brevibacillus brevis]
MENKERQVEVKELPNMTVAGGKYAVTRFTINAEEFSKAWE